MNLEKIKKAIEHFAKQKDLNLYSVTYNKGDLILEVRFDEDLNLDDLEILSNELSTYLDQYDDEFEDNYFLDVSNVGLERDILNEDEMFKAVGSYIYIKTKENEYYGNLKSFIDNKIELEVKDKGKKKVVEIAYKDVKNARYAVEF